MAEEENNGAKLTTAKFSEYVMDVQDLYTLANKNGYYLPAEKLSTVCKFMIFQFLQGLYWCPKYEQIRMKPCPRPPHEGRPRGQADGDLRPRELQRRVDR